MLSTEQNTTNQYDAQIGRWHSIDKMAELDFSSSGYAYVGGNPVIFYDILGLVFGDPAKRAACDHSSGSYSDDYDWEADEAIARAEYAAWLAQNGGGGVNISGGSGGTFFADHTYGRQGGGSAGGIPGRIYGRSEGPIVIYGVLVGYLVEAGQGPTQIAEDINKRVAAGEFSLHFKVTYLDIVNSNPDKFTNVENINDPYDEGFTKLNMNEGDILSVRVITEKENKILNTQHAIIYNYKLLSFIEDQYEQNKKDIANSQYAVQCFKEEAIAASRERIEEFYNMPNIGYFISSNYVLNQERKKLNHLKIKQQNILKSKDSILSIIDSLEEQIK